VSLTTRLHRILLLHIVEKYLHSSVRLEMSASLRPSAAALSLFKIRLEGMHVLSVCVTAGGKRNFIVYFSIMRVN
jgi:hypothetical protein